MDFAISVIDTVEGISASRRHYRLLEQIEASFTSIAMNIAEGKGRFSKKEFVRYLYVARASLYETMTLLEILRRKEWISGSQYKKLEKDGKEIASMTVGSIRSIRS